MMMERTWQCVPHSLMQEAGCDAHVLQMYVCVAIKRPPRRRGRQPNCLQAWRLATEKVQKDKDKRPPEPAHKTTAHWSFGGGTRPSYRPTTHWHFMAIGDAPWRTSLALFYIHCIPGSRKPPPPRYIPTTPADR
jgi:hypothetical protein